jgi:hypothetical protein
VLLSCFVCLFYMKPRRDPLPEDSAELRRRCADAEQEADDLRSLLEANQYELTQTRDRLYAATRLVADLQACVVRLQRASAASRSSSAGGVEPPAAPSADVVDDPGVPPQHVDAGIASESAPDLSPLAVDTARLRSRSNDSAPDDAETSPLAIRASAEPMSSMTGGDSQPSESTSLDGDIPPTPRRAVRVSLSFFVSLYRILIA